MTKKEQKDFRLKVIAQAQGEISHSRKYKQGKVAHWKDNEEMYYGKKQVSSESRANVELGRMQEFVHTLLSKIDNPLIFKFIRRKEAQLKRVQRLNSLREYDRQRNWWDDKDILGKKQAIIYGRAIYSYYADDIDGYEAHLDNVDIHDFLIDPAGGGFDLENALYLGRYGIVKMRNEIEKGSKDGSYIKEDATFLLSGSGNSAEQTQEWQNQTTRRDAQNTVGEKEISNPDKYKFWEWFTTYDGDRYYLLMQENGYCLRFEKLTDLFSPTKQFKAGAWPFWSWASFPDLTEFWTPGYCDYVREIFQTQNVSINQLLDNAEAINKPQKVVNVFAIENLAELKYRKDGLIKTKGDYDAGRVIQPLRPPAIDTPIEVYNILEAIQEKALGVTAGAKGVADEEGKVGIYEGNMEAMADRFGLLNKSYSFGYHKFAKLYEIGVRDNLNKKIAIDIIGPDGIETEEVSRSDIYKKDDDFAVLVEASNAEDMSSKLTQRTKLAFLASKAIDPTINPKKRNELEAKIAGFTDDEIRELMDTDNFGNSMVISEAARDIESLMEGDLIKPNQVANTAYVQKLVDWGRDHEEDMNDKQKGLLILYIQTLEPIVMRNMARKLTNEMTQLTAQNPALPTGGEEQAGIPINPQSNYEQEVPL